MNPTRWPKPLRWILFVALWLTWPIGLPLLMLKFMEELQP